MNRIWDYIFGLSSLLGLIGTLVIQGMEAWGETEFSGTMKLFFVLCAALITTLSFLSSKFYMVSRTVKNESKSKSSEISHLKEKIAKLEVELKAEKSALNKFDTKFSSLKSSEKTIQRELENANVQLQICNQELILSKSDQTLIVEYLHNIYHCLRDDKNSLYRYIKEPGKTSKYDEALEKLKVKNCLKIAVASIKQILDRVTNDECSVCIKMVGSQLIQSKEVVTIRTLMRDSKFERQREKLDNIEIPVSKEPVFQLMLEANKNNNYSSDNLSNEKNFMSFDEAWHERYNAIFVTPIRIKISNDPIEHNFEKYSVLGFICVDNKKGRLNTDFCRHLLASIADSLYVYLILFHHASIKFESTQEAKKIENSVSDKVVL